MSVCRYARTSSFMAATRTGTELERVAEVGDGVADRVVHRREVGVGRVLGPARPAPRVRRAHPGVPHARNGAKEFGFAATHASSLGRISFSPVPTAAAAS